jgi:type IV pilus assembly protein PilQ
MHFLRTSMRIIFVLFLFIHPAFAKPTAQDISLDLQNVNLPDAIRIVGKFMHLNLVLSSAVTGSVSLQLQHASPDDAFSLLLVSQGLAKWQKGNVFYIAPRTELVSRQQDESKLREAAEDSVSLVTRIWQIHYAKADDVAHLLQDTNASLLSKRAHVRVDSRTNKLCVQELPNNLAALDSLIQKLDVPVQQVLIEARLASVDNDYERELGVNFSAHALAIGGKSRAVQEAPVMGSHFSLAVATLADGSFLDVVLSAMENEGRGELISSPSLFTANQQPASIESGEEIPYQEVSRSGGTGVAFKKAVLSLKVTPQIMPGNKVLLQLQVNQDRPSNRIVLGVPAISTRQITTSILVKNGQTLVLGGIYELNKEHDVGRIPFLGKKPLVGLLFQQQNAKENKRELLIFVTPKIIS